MNGIGELSNSLFYILEGVASFIISIQKSFNWLKKNVAMVPFTHIQ